MAEEKAKFATLFALPSFLIVKKFWAIELPKIIFVSFAFVQQFEVFIFPSSLPSFPHPLSD